MAQPKSSLLSAVAAEIRLIDKSLKVTIRTNKSWGHHAYAVLKEGVELIVRVVESGVCITHAKWVDNGLDAADPDFDLDWVRTHVLVELRDPDSWDRLRDQLRIVVAGGSP